MKRREAACPACGAPVEFEIGSVVAVCDFCQSAVGRGDKKVEDYGKVADLVETSSRLRRGLMGKFNKKPFTIMGHVQYRHPAGGVWDEWYLALPGNKWGWLAEAQGKTHLMFERRLARSMQLPEFDDLDVGRTVRLGDTDFTVAERGIAETIAAEGQIPWEFRSGGEHRFADLHSADGTFATFEYGESGTRAFVGKEISLEDLQLEGPGWQLEEEKIAVTALQVKCPQCGGPLALRAPDHTLRVACQSCNSLLDAEGGKLSYLRTLKSSQHHRMVIPLGAEGTLFGKQYTVIGFMRRYVVYEGQTFHWSEYLLYEPSVGFRWLVHNDDHWSFVQPLPQLKVSYHVPALRHDGDNFRIYDRGTAYVSYVVGEFFWKVEVGETVRTADFIAPPRMISGEWSKTKSSEEVNISLGTYVTPDEIQQAFELKSVPRPWGVGVIQPGPRMPGTIYLLWFIFCFLLMLTFVIYARKADAWLWIYSVFFVSLPLLCFFLYLWSFEVRRWENSDYSPYATE